MYWPTHIFLNFHLRLTRYKINKSNSMSTSHWLFMFKQWNSKGIQGRNPVAQILKYGRRIPESGTSLLNQGSCRLHINADSNLRKVVWKASQLSLTCSRSFLRIKLRFLKLNIEHFFVIYINKHWAWHQVCVGVR